ncbi:hypothetical protein BDY21DRAFT_357983 [Lineolata rhizophorae]|uniref:Uncharacterized protein n=1 Tax=Lineolata rhizophorae TaxID=578093 RepID=A0A6A6NM81_9PEZI|nr:hypothetical protein BDY21DRAFT_357983 [Lineolata rhizophorae]
MLGSGALGLAGRGLGCPVERIWRPIRPRRTDDERDGGPGPVSCRTQASRTTWDVLFSCKEWRRSRAIRRCCTGVLCSSREREPPAAPCSNLMRLRIPIGCPFQHGPGSSVLATYAWTKAAFLTDCLGTRSCKASRGTSKTRPGHNPGKHDISPAPH